MVDVILEVRLQPMLLDPIRRLDTIALKLARHLTRQSLHVDIPNPLPRGRCISRISLLDPIRQHLMSRRRSLIFRTKRLGNCQLGELHPTFNQVANLRLHRLHRPWDVLVIQETVDGRPISHLQERSIITSL